MRVSPQQKGRIDLVMMDVSLYQAQYMKNPDYRTYEFGSDKDNYAFAVKKDSDLKTEINKHLAAVLKDGTAQEIADKFFSEDYSDEPAVIRWNNKNAAASATPVPTSTPFVVPTAAVVQQNCNYQMAYVTDVTIPDGQAVSAGSSFTKTWRIRNTGNCAWTQAFTMSYVSGSATGGTAAYLPATVYPGDSVDVSVNLKAPDEAGTYQGNWQLKTPQGAGIGPSIWVIISVPSGGGASYPTSAPVYSYPTATPDYSTSITLAPTATPYFHEIKEIPTATPYYHIFKEFPTATPVPFQLSTPYRHVIELATATPAISQIKTLSVLDTIDLDKSEIFEILNRK